MAKDRLIRANYPCGCRATIYTRTGSLVSFSIECDAAHALFEKLIDNNAKGGPKVERDALSASLRTHLTNQER